MNKQGKALYQTSSAVLFIIFNRPGTTEKVFGQIKQARPARLYIAADGPRADKPGEQLLCEQARNITKQIDWPCEVKTLFRDNNMGCKNAVSSAITWFFEHDEEGIILEDDCLPANDFFRFCDAMLETYRHDERVRHICGCNLQHGKKWGEASYYFSNLSHVWGWAGWRRVWKDYDKDLSNYRASDITSQLANIFEDKFIVETWAGIFEQVKAGQIDTWDYQLSFLNFFNNGLGIIPNVNLITNIGFGESSTHTNDINNINANLPVQALGDITHPLYVLPQKQADVYTLNADFDIASRWKKHNKPKYKAKRWFKGLFNNTKSHPNSPGWLKI